MNKPNIRLVEIRRVSTEDQARDDRSGLDRQADSNRRTAERVGATLIEPPIVITDVCRENFIDTPEWRTIRALIADPNVHIVVDMQDRIVGALEGIPILIECKRTHTLIYHSQGITDPNTFAGQLLATFSALSAGNELHSIRHRAQGGKEAKRRRGLFPSSAISLATGIAYVRGKGQSGRWTYDEKIGMVREVYRLVVEEGVRNWREVARRSGANNEVTVRNILLNPIYKGWWIVDERRQPGPTPIRADGRRRDRKKVKRAPEEVIRHQVFKPKGVPADPNDNREEAVVDEATWDLVQSVVEEKRQGFYNPREPRGDTRFTYTGRIWCADCGNIMWSKTRPASGRHITRRDWYACKSTQMAGSNCSTKYLKREIVNGGLDQLFMRLVSDECFVATLNGERKDLTAEINTSRNTLKKIEEQRSRLLDLYLDGTWDRAELNARHVRLDDERDKVERELRRLQLAQESDASTLLQEIREAFPALSEFLAWAPLQKRALLARFFPRIEVSKRGVERLRTTLPNHDSLSTVALAWDDLLPSRQLKFNALGFESKALYKRADIKAVLGLTDAQFVTRVKSGVILKPIAKRRGHKAWSEQQVQEMVQDATAAKQPGALGLPQKPFYTTGDLCGVLGLSWDRVRRLIDRGEIQHCGRRDANGHRVWSVAEIQQAMEHAKSFQSAAR